MSDDFFEGLDMNNDPQQEPRDASDEDILEYNPYQEEPTSRPSDDPVVAEPAALDPEPETAEISMPEAPAPEPETAELSAFDTPELEPLTAELPSPEPSFAPEPGAEPSDEAQTPKSSAQIFAEMYRPTDSSSKVLTTEPYRQPSAAPASSSAATSAPDNNTPYGRGDYYRSFAGQETTNPYQRAPRREPAQKKIGIGKGSIVALLIVCILLSGAAGFGGSVLANKMNSNNNNNSSANKSAAAPTEMSDQNDDDDTDTARSSGPDKTTAEIAEIAAPSVVEITTEVVQTSEFYEQYITQGAGSGVIIDKDGTIMTNNHVIEDSKDITVTLRSGESFEAEVVGADEELDIALIRIDAGETELTVASMGDSDTLKVGDKSVIIGNPLGTLGGSVTEGIISALDRSIVIDNKTMNLMQTDAAINAGNSGGGMFNGQGELIGIVVAKNYSGEVDNIGFVIPINAAKSIMEDLEVHGYVRGRADTGMTFVDINNALYAWYYFQSGSTGCYVKSVEAGSNAEKAGFRIGDRIVSIDGKDVEQTADVRSAISGKTADDEVEFVIERGGSTLKLTLTLQEKVPESVRSGE